LNESYGNFSHVVLGRIIPLSFQAAFFLIFAALLDPKDYGMMGYLIAVAVTVSVVSLFGLPQTAVVYLGKGEMLKVNQINFLALITTSIASIILLFIDQFAAILCLGIGFFFMYQHNLLGEKKYKSYMKNAALRGVLTFFLPFVLYFVLDIPGIVLGLALGNLLSGFKILKLIDIRIKSFQILKQDYKVLINNFAVAANNNLVRQIDRVFVATIFGFMFVGVYIFIMQILFALEILPRSLYLYLLSEESSGKEHKKISYLVVASSVIIVVVVVFFSPLAIETFFPKYSDGIVGLQILVISIIPESVALILSAKMQAKESTKVGYSAIIRIGSLLVLIGILGSMFELIGVSFAVLISTILNAVFLYFLYTKLRGND